MLNNISSVPNKKNIVALGELLVDFVPAEPEMKLCEAGQIIKTASGSSGIFACAAAQLCGESGFLGQIGNDSLSQMVYDIVKKQGVDLSHCAKSNEGQIGLAFIEYLPEGRNYQYYRENSVGSHYSEQQLDVDYIKNSFALHYSGMLLELSDEMRSACIKAASIAKQNGVLVSFDPNIRKELMHTPLAQKRLEEALKSADIIAPTLDEGKFITGHDAPGDVLRALHKAGCKIVALTRDKDGAIISDGKKVVFVGGIDVPAIDPTGAGDTFAAALVYCIREGFSLEDTAIFCNSAGTLVTTKRGAIGIALPTLAQVKEMVQKKLCTVESFELNEI